MTKHLLAYTMLGLTLMPAITTRLLAQQPEGELTGTVVDPSGALVPGAQITVVNSSGFQRTIKTSPSGSFAVSHLAPGSYSVSVDAVGFTPALEGGIQVVSDEVTSDQIKLGISVNQEIQVWADQYGPTTTDHPSEVPVGHS